MAIDQDVPNGNKPENSSGEESGASQTVLDVSDNGSVQLPEGVSLSEGNVEQAGSDLIITQDDGSQLVVQDYFASDTPPDIQTADGGQIPGDLVESLAGPVAPGQVAEAGTAIGAQPIGSVDKVEGEVIAIRADGTEVELNVGDPVFQGDVLKSGEDGAIGVVMADDSTFSMAQNGEMVLDEMVYDPGTQEGSMDVSIVKGVFTFVSGQIAKTDPDAMQLDTPVATIGIRGTQVGINFEDGKNLTAALMEEADGFVGEIVVTNTAGQQIINVAGEATTVSSYQTPPSDIFSLVNDNIIELFGPALKYLPMEVGTGYDYGVQENENGEEDDDFADLKELTEFETAAGGNEGEGAGEGEEEGGGGEFNDYESEEAGVEFGEVIPEPVVPEVPEPDPIAQDDEDTTTTTDTSNNTTTDPDQQYFNEDGSYTRTLDGSEPFDRTDANYDINITGGTEGNVISTGSGNDVIDGGGGDDTLYAGDGDDLVLGGDGADTFDAGTGGGKDTYVGGNADGTDDSDSDFIEFDSTTEGIVVDLREGEAYDAEYGSGEEAEEAIDAANEAMAEDSTLTREDLVEDGDLVENGIDYDTLSGIENVTGGSGDDTFIGDSKDNVLDGGADGHDTVIFQGDFEDYTVTTNEDGSLTIADSVSDRDGSDTIYNMDTVQFADQSFTVDEEGNFVPVAQDASGEGAEDNTISGSLEAADLEGSDLTFSLASEGGPSNGTVDVNDDGTYTYTPNPDFNGSDSFTYQVDDGNGGVTTATVSLDVAAVNDAPTANAVSGSMDENAVSATIDLSGEYADIDSADLTVTVDTGNSGWSGSVDENGILTFTPPEGSDFNSLAEGESQTFEFSYTVSDGEESVTKAATVTVEGSNDAPTANAVSGSMDENDLSATIDLSGEYADVDSSNLTVTADTGDSGWSWSLGEDGNLTFTPPRGSDFDSMGADDVATFDFTYTVSDGTDSVTQTATVTVNGSNDAPTAEVVTGSGDEDKSISGTLSGADAEGDVTYGLAEEGGPAHGDVSIDADGNYTYTPDPDFNGTDSFTYTVTDDDGVSTTSTVNLTINAVNDAPTANAVEGSMGEDDLSVTIDLAGEYADVDSADLTVSANTGDSGWSWSFGEDGKLTFTPPADSDFDSMGADDVATFDFTYTVDDGTATVTQTATVTVNGSNDAPTADVVTGSGDEDKTISGTLSGADAEGDVTYGLAEEGGPAHGDVSIDADGNYTYTPDPDFNGTDSFTYTVTDDDGVSTTSTVNLTINAVNDAPTANAVAGSMGEDDLSVTIELAGEYADVDSADLTVSADTGNSGWSWSLNDDGNLVFEPPAVNDLNSMGANDVATFDFTYTVSDGTDSVTQTATVTVNGSNDAPTADVVTGSGDEDKTISGTLSGADAEGDVTYGLAAEGGPANGKVTVDADGNYTYTPDPDFNGTDSFTYTVTDENDVSTTSTVNLTINAVNDAPTANNIAGSMDEDALTTTVSLDGEFADVDSSNLTVSVNTGESGWTAEIVGSDIIFTAPAENDFNSMGPGDSQAFVFNYTVSDGEAQVTKTATVTVNGSNDAPTASNVVVDGDEDTIISGKMVGSDVEGDVTYSVAANDGPQNGTVTLDGDSFSYEPNLDFNGQDSFTYTVTDEDGATTTATVTINVAQVEEEPIIGDDQDNVLTGGIDDEVIEGQGGSDEITGGGGNDEIDGGEGDDTAVVQGTYNEYEIDVDEGEVETTVTITDTVEDRDGEDTLENIETVQFGDGTTYDVEEGVLQGTEGDDTIIGTDDEDIIDGGGGNDNITGSDGDDEIEGGEGNDVLYAEGGDDIVSGGAGDDIIIGGSGEGNDQYDGGEGTDTVTYTSTTEGIVVDLEEGVVTDAAGVDYIDTDTLTDVENVTGGSGDDDFRGDSNDNVFDGGEGTDTVTFSGNFADYNVTVNQDGSLTVADTVQERDGTDTIINFEKVNFADQSFAMDEDGNFVPVAEDGSARGAEDTDITGTLEAADLEGSDLTFSLAPEGNAGNGNVVVNEDGTYTYTPNTNFNGQDSFTYQVDDGNGGVTTATVTLNVAEVNDAPTAENLTNSGDEDKVITGTLDGADVEGAVTYGLATEGGPANGSVSIEADGSYTYTPDPNYFGTDSFTYEVTDSDGVSTTATVTLNVASVNDEALIGSAGNDDLNVVEDAQGDTASGQLTITDADGASEETFNSASGSANFGTFTISDTGAWSYTLDNTNENVQGLGDGEVMTDSFVVTSVDGTQATITVDITGTADAPVVTAEQNISVERGATVDVQISATDADGDTVYYRVAEESEGTLLLDGEVLGLDAVFTQDDLDSGLLQYRADASVEAHSWAADTPAWMVDSSQDGNSVPEGNRGTESGTQTFGGGRNFSSWEGMGMTAFALGESYLAADGTLDLTGGTADVTFRSNRGLGVDGDLAGGAGTRASYQINHAAEGSDNQYAGQSEALALDFGEEAESARVQISSMFKNEHEGEKGRWEAFDAAGNKVGEGVLDETTVDYKNSHEGYLDIGADDVSANFQHLVFTATSYADDTTVTNDSSDITIKSVEYEPGGQSALEENLEVPDGATSVDVTFEGAMCGYNNVLGMYTIDEQGDMSDFQLLWDDLGDDVKGTTSTVNLENLDEGDSIGFFLVSSASGWFENSANYDQTSTMTMNDQNELVVTTGDHVHTFQDHKVFNTHNGGSDNVMDVASGIGEDGNLWIGFEDQVNGDKDFNDVMISMNFNVEASTTDKFTLTVSDTDPNTDSYSTQNTTDVTFSINIDDVT